MDDISRMEEWKEEEEEEEDVNSLNSLVSADTEVLMEVKRASVVRQNGTSTFGTIFLIVNAALGAGLLNFPQAFDQGGGVLVGVLVQAVLLIFIMLALVILAKTSNINQSKTLQEVMSTAAGPWGRRVTSLIVAIYCFGTCITFLIIIGDQFDRAFASIVGPNFCHTWYLNRDFIMPATSIVLILPMCYSKNIDFLQYASMAGVATIVYVVVLILVEYSSGDHVAGPIKHGPDNWTDVFTVIPVICFGYQCHVSVIPIYSCMKHRNIKHFSVASFSAIGICVSVYTGAATFGYLTFGNQVSGDILTNYNANKPTVMVALIAMAFKTYTTYPILLFCGREGTNSLIKDLIVREDTEGKEKFRRVLIASLWFLLSMVLAVEIPNIGTVINMLGSLAAVFIFVFPGVCLLQVSLFKDPSLANSKTRLKVLLAFLFLMIGAFLFGVVLTQALIFNSSGDGSSPPLCVVTSSTDTDTEDPGLKFVKLFRYYQ